MKETLFEFFNMRTKPCFEHKWLLCLRQSLIHMLKFQCQGIRYIIIICIVFAISIPVLTMAMPKQNNIKWSIESEIYGIVVWA